MKENSRDLVLGFRPITPKFCVLRIKEKFYIITVYLAAMPLSTEVSVEDEKEEFCKECIVSMVK